MARKIAEIRRDVPGHWVGDGFPVRTLFSYSGDGARVDPFLLLDYAAPTEFAPSAKARGVEQHPHRGFETVTIVYSGELEHRDSAGHHGQIGPGDVQWMTAGRGVLHEEFHGRRFAAEGGTFEVVQLWVNLPAADKMTPPRYQAITADQIPRVALSDGAGHARIIAGELHGVRGPARTFTPIELWDVELVTGGRFEMALPGSYNVMLVVQRGELAVHETESVSENRQQRGGQAPFAPQTPQKEPVPGGSWTQIGRPPALVLFQGGGGSIHLSSDSDSRVLVLAGEPLGEPIAGYGPFVMNTPEQIQQAIADYRAGRFGQA